MLKWHIESTLDKEMILKIATEKNADLVISSSVDQANAVCCYVAEKLGLPHPYSYETALNVTDKSRMKKIMNENGIDTPRYLTASGIKDIYKKDLCFPVMIKPADSNSAKGVEKVERLESIPKAFDEAKRHSRNGKIIVEEYIDGIEISAYSYIFNHEPYLIMVQERLSVYDGNGKVIKCYASIAPARISQKAYDKVKGILKDIAEAFALDNTPLFFQGIVRGDRVSVLEFAPRTGGGISTRTMKVATGFDFIKATVESYLGEKPKLSGYHGLSKIYAVNQVYAENGIIGEIRGIETVKKEAMVDILSFYKHVNNSTNSCSAGTSRVLVMVVSGGSENEIRGKIEKVFNTIDVIDTEGKSIIRRDLSIARIGLGKE